MKIFVFLSILLLFNGQLTYSQKSSKFLKIAKNEKDIKLAIKHYENALKFASEEKNDSIYCEISLEYASRINQNQNYFNVTEILFHCLSRAEKIGSIRFLGQTHYSLAKNYYSLMLLEKSKKEIFIAKEFFEKEKNHLGIIQSLNLLGTNYTEVDSNKIGIYYYKKALEIAKKHNIEGQIASLVANIGLGYEQENKLDSAVILLNSALNMSIMKTPEQNALQTGTLIELAYIYFLKKQYKLGIVYGNNALKTANPENKDFISYAHRVLYKLYRAKGDNSNALKYFIKYNDIRDSLDNQLKTQQMNAQIAIYENDKKAFEIETKNQELGLKDLQRNVMTAFAIFLLTFAVIFWRSRNKISTQRDQLSEMKLNLEKLNITLEQKVEERTKELSMANADLIRKNKEITEALYKGQSIERQRVASELHDQIGGTLSTINWALQSINKNNLGIGDYETLAKIEKMTKTAYSDVRNLSHNMLPEILDEFGLIDTINRLIEDLNNNDKVKFSFKTNLKLDIGNKQIELNLYAIVLELCNNIIKHSEANTASIKLFLENNEYTLSIYDNGKGLDSKKKTAGKGFENLKKRVDLLNGNLKINENNGLEFIIKFSVFL